MKVEQMICMTHFYVCVVKQKRTGGGFACHFTASGPLDNDDILSVLMAKVQVAGWDLDEPIVCDIVQFEDLEAACEFYAQQGAVDAPPPSLEETAAFARQIERLGNFKAVDPVSQQTMSRLERKSWISPDHSKRIH